MTKSRARLAHTFGSWRNFALTTDDGDSDWSSLGTLQKVYEDARAGDALAARVISLLPVDVVVMVMAEARAPPPAISLSPPPAPPQMRLFAAGWSV